MIEKDNQLYLFEIPIKRINLDLNKYKFNNRFEELNESIIFSYIAGFIDGEGHFSIIKNPYKNKAMPTPRIGITNTNIDILLLIKKYLGGNICIEKRAQKNHKIKCYLHIGGIEKVYKICLKLNPFIILKKTQCELMIRFCESRLNNFNTPYTQEELAIYEKMRILNKRGVIILGGEENG